MNNEIDHNLNKPVSMPRQDKKSSSACESVSEEMSKIEHEQTSTMQDSLNYMGTINKIKVTKNPNNVKQSMLAFKNDPLKVELYNELYDSFISRGHSAEDAIIKTDSIFKILKTKSTYKD